MYKAILSSVKILHKKLLDYSYIQFAYQTGHAPFWSSVLYLLICRTQRGYNANIQRQDLESLNNFSDLRETPHHNLYHDDGLIS